MHFPRSCKEKIYNHAAHAGITVINFIRVQIKKYVVLGIIILFAVILFVANPPQTARTNAPLQQSIYVWQRTWGPHVKESVAINGAQSNGLIALAAEVGYTNGEPTVATVRIDYPCLLTANQPIGLALRIGPCPSNIASLASTKSYLCKQARDIIENAKTFNCQPTELQIDFDCATSKLLIYRDWIQAIAKEIAPIPVTITALPAWMSNKNFGELVNATKGFVLQVHSLDQARLENNSPSLCDANAAVDWVEKASRCGVPFLVALPTYGYIVVYDDNGKVRGLIAESGGPELAAGSTIQEVRSDPQALSQLVHQWSVEHPAMMKGIIWYRLPVVGDRMNWSWATLHSVMQGKTPQPNLVIRQKQTEPCLIEFFAFNDGNDDAPIPTTMTAQWTDVDLIASDALAGMELENSNPQQVTFKRQNMAILDRLRPGEERQIGWLRLNKETKVNIHVN